jgi:hypothetical protein
MPRRADTDSNLSESADRGTHPNLRSSLYNTLFCAHCVTVRGEAEDNPPIFNVNGVDDEDLVVIDDYDGLTSLHSPPSFFASWNRRRSARLSSGTTAIDNNDMTVKGLGRLSLIPRLEGRRFRCPSKIACKPQNTGRLHEIPNRHRRRQCPVAGGTVLFNSLVATLLATANPASTGCHSLALTCCLAGEVRTLSLQTTKNG